MQRICGPFCFEHYHYAFQDTLCPVTLAHQIFVFYSSLYFYTSNTFRPILARFSHILVYTNFFLMCFSTQNMFLIPDDAVARNLTIIFNFSSQRPHLNYILLSCSYLPTKLQATLLLFNKSESLECAKVVVLKLGAILCYSGIHVKPLKL